MSQYAFSHPDISVEHVEAAIAAAKNESATRVIQIPTVDKIRAQLWHRCSRGIPTSTADVYSVFSHIRTTIVKADLAMRRLGDRCATAFRQELLQTIPHLLYVVGVCINEIPPHIRKEAAPILLNVILEADSLLYRYIMSVISTRFTDDEYNDKEIEDISAYIQGKLASSLFIYTHHLEKKLGPAAAEYVRHLEEEEVEAERVRQSVKKGEACEDESLMESVFDQTIHACAMAYEHHDIFLGDFMQGLNEEVIKALVMSLDVMGAEPGNTGLLTSYVDYAKFLVEEHLPEEVEPKEYEAAELEELKLLKTLENMRIGVKKETLEKMERKIKVMKIFNTRIGMKKMELLKLDEEDTKLKKEMEKKEMKKEEKKDEKKEDEEEKTNKEKIRDLMKSGGNGQREVKRMLFINNYLNKENAYHSMDLDDAFYDEAALYDEGYVDIHPHDAPKEITAEPQQQQDAKPQKQQKVRFQKQRGSWWPSGWFR